MCAVSSTCTPTKIISIGNHRNAQEGDWTGSPYPGAGWGDRGLKGLMTQLAASGGQGSQLEGDNRLLKLNHPQSSRVLPPPVPTALGMLPALLFPAG